MRRRLILLFCFAFLALAQNGEVTTREAPVTFRSDLSLVPVTVVVRDRNGRAVDNLGIDDFQLLDNGKPQIISKFSIERFLKNETLSKKLGQPKLPSRTSAGSDGIPNRFVIYLFDDIHMSQTDRVYTRDAVRRRIDTAANPLERAAVYSTSGQPMQDFTPDKQKLLTAVDAVGTGRSAVTKTLYEDGCPAITYYMADLVEKKNDDMAVKILISDAKRCGGFRSRSELEGEARDVLSQGDRATQSSFDAMQNAIARLASMPGQRTLVLISPGFVVREDFHDRESALIERAARANVVIGTLDSEGVSTQGGQPAASDIVSDTALIPQKMSYKRMESFELAGVMTSLAEGTGGTFYHGSNDMGEGIARTTTAPDVLYVLGFSPLDLKFDGKYHNLKVTLKSNRGLDLQFRKGYFAPQSAADPAERAKQELEEAFFSRDEIHALPATLQAQFFKSPNGEATISAIAKVDVKHLAFRKEDGRNLDNLTIVTGIFDGDGNFVSGLQKVVELKLLDQTIEKRLAAGLGVTSSFTVRSGKYIVRMVARDSEGNLMSSASTLVEIP